MSAERPMIFSGPKLAFIDSLGPRATFQARSVLWHAHSMYRRRGVPQRYFAHMGDKMRLPEMWAGAVCPARERGWIACFPGTDPDIAAWVKETYREGFDAPHGMPGDSVWVKEVWGLAGTPERFVYRADPSDDAQWGAGKSSQGGFRWRSPIVMPRVASRRSFEIVDVQAQRLHDITPDDVRAEGWLGYEPGLSPAARALWAAAWNSLHGKRAPFKVNPWVWRYTLKKQEARL